jgi:phosphatidate phosphatase APP1
MDELPEVRATLDRLIAAGHSRQQAIELIADSFTKAMWIIVDDPGAPDLEQYKALLDELK